MDLRELPTASFRRHPWEVARADFFSDLVRRRQRTAAPLSVIDVGAGDGYFARRLIELLPPESRVTCFDPNYTDEHLRRLVNDAPVGISFTRERPAALADWMILLDVIEHVADDVGFVKGLVETTLAPGGTVLISVPAWPALFSRHDQVLGHHRRYRPGELARVVERAGLDEAEKGSLFTSLLLPRAVSKALEVLRATGEAETPGPPEPLAAADVSGERGGRLLATAARLALDADAACGRALGRFGVTLPGLSLWTRATKQ